MKIKRIKVLILVNLRMLIRNLNVTKLENPQFLRNLQFLAFSGEIANTKNRKLRKNAAFKLGNIQIQNQHPLID